MTKKKTLLLIILSVPILLTFAVFRLVYCTSVEPRCNFRQSLTQYKDFQRISYEAYDTVFLSMFPIDNYKEADFSYYRGLTVLKTDNILQDSSDLERYFNHIAETDNPVSTAYLGICPERVTVAEISELARNYPSISFEILLFAPSATYWQKLTGEEYSKNMNAYQEFLADAGQCSDAKFFFLSAESWLVNNPANYIDDISLTEDAAHKILAYTFRDSFYQTTAENTDELVQKMRREVTAAREYATAYPCLSQYEIVFWGDSVIGNYTDSTSIPGVVNALTGATVYNCGYSGNSAAMAPDLIISLPGIVDAFFAHNLSVIPEGEQIYEGTKAYFNYVHDTQRQCYVINYGLNDYFQAFPISSDDSFDITTYAGALRTAVKTIRENSPESQIILCTPTYTAYAQDESDDSADVRLQDYIDAVIALGDELNVDVLDNYYNLGINFSNHEEYLLDMVHPNEKGRFIIAQRIIEAIR